MKQPKYSAKDEQELMAFVWSLALSNDPYTFVKAMFPWGKAGTPLAHFKGPRRWQRKVLQQIANHVVKGQIFDLNEVLQLARASGRGIGKSALVAWLVLWFVSTRIGATAIISANTEDQLRKITFAELSKWTAMALNEHWFEVTGITLNPAKWLCTAIERDLQKGTTYWGAIGKLWSEENPDAYAGVHNHDGVMVIFDEASGIPDAIWSVAKGFFTEPTPNRFWFAFSQGRRNSGYFFEIFHKNRDRWDQDQIDARDVEGTDPKVYEDIIDEYGEDSDEARVEVYGLFPNDDDVSFISHSVVEKASKRKIDDKTAPIIIGVDPAGTSIGGDKFVICVRQGSTILDIRRFKLDDNEKGTMEGVGHVIDAIEQFEPAMTVIDETGIGKPIKDRLNEQKYRVKGVNFAWASKEKKRYGNMRAQMWAAMKRWLETSAIPNDKYLKADLIGPRKKPDSKNVMFLESKRDMKSRKLASPDSADALAVTFAFPVAHREYNGGASRRAKGPIEHDVPHVATGWLKN